jgi:uncharacterized protein
MARLLLPLVLVLLALAPSTVASAAVPAGADWTQLYIPTPDGQSLHVDLLRPKSVPKDAKTPVIAIVSPYLGHAVDGIPSDRFKDLFDGAKVFERGYTVAMVDLRGSGGSSGCLDILGPGEQTDIKTAVEWAASQPWSNGRVGMYGKSYDGNTGVAGAAIRPKGLHAVVGQQVVGDRYSGSYSGGVRYLQSVAYPSVSYGTQAEGGWTESDDAQYAINSFSHSADCQVGLAGHYNPDPNTDFWKSRDFVAKGKGSTVPFLMTHGFVDANTNIGAKAIDFFNGLQGPKRLWLGWWDHVRGNDKVGSRLAMGREGWFDEVMRFYDEHLKGIKPAVQDPAVVVQDSDGRWRSETAWPPADAVLYSVTLNKGTYSDNGRNLGSRDFAAGAGGSAQSTGNPYVTGAGVWTISPPLPHAVHLAGIPKATVALQPQAPQTNLVVNVYDIGPDRKATMISRGARLVDGAGNAELPLYPSEWTFAPGHRIGVLVSGANAEAWVHTATNTQPSVGGGTISLPLLSTRRTPDQPGLPAPRLTTFKQTAPFELDAQVVTGATQGAFVPPAQRNPVAPPATTAGSAQPGRTVPAPPAATVTGRSVSLRYTVRIARRSLRVAARRGLAGRATCTARCTLRVALTVDRRTAKRLKLRSRTVGVASLNRAFVGTKRFTLRFNRAARRRLGRARNVRFAIAVVGRDAVGRRSTSRGKLSLRR